MAVDLAALLAPEHTAVLTMELQRGIVGDHSAIAELAATSRPEARITALAFRRSPLRDASAVHLCDVSCRLTANDSALRLPTRTTSFLPRVTAVYRRLRCRSM